jgi:hypothetical protein
VGPGSARASVVTGILLTGLWVAVATVPRSLIAQADTVVVVADEPVCDLCKPPHATRLRELGSANDPLSPTWTSTVAFDGRLYFVAPLAGESEEIAVFDSGGFAWSAGREGQGPGEFLSIRHVGWGGEGLQVLSAGRLTYLDRALNPIGSRPLEGEFYKAVTLDDTLTILNGWMSTSENAGYPLHSVTPGSVRSMGPPASTLSSEGLWEIWRILGPSRRSHAFWAARPNRYELQEWDVEGELRGVVVVEAPWFPPWSPPIAPNSERLWKPAIVAIRQDLDGILWVASVVPKSDAYKTRRSDVVSMDEVALLYDGHVDALDVSASRALASFRVPGAPLGFVAPRILAVAEPAQLGIVKVVLYAVSPGGAR